MRTNGGPLPSACTPTAEFAVMIAMAEIRRFSGTQFCPELVDELVALVEEGLPARLKDIPKIPAFDNVYTKWIRRADLHV